MTLYQGMTTQKEKAEGTPSFVFPFKGGTDVTAISAVTFLELPFCFLITACFAGSILFL